MILIALAGLPGVGKSTLARALAAELDAPILDKDRVRDALFGPSHVTYTRAQDDHVVELLLSSVAWLSRTQVPVALLDGRTFARAADVRSLRAAVAASGAKLVLIECRCGPDVARARLSADAARGAHPAANRGPELYDRLAASADPVDADLVVWTEDPPGHAVRRCLDVVARLRAET